MDPVRRRAAAPLWVTFVVLLMVPVQGRSQDFDPSDTGGGSISGSEDCIALCGTVTSTCAIIGGLQCFCMPTQQPSETNPTGLCILPVAGFPCGFLGACEVVEHLHELGFFNLAEAPHVDAGPDVTAAPGELVLLDGTGSTADSEMVYLWRQVSGPAVSVTHLDTHGTASFTSPDAPPGTTLTFSLTVFTQNGGMAADTMSVHIEGPDADGDGLGDAEDACPFDPDNDADWDGVCGDVDVCPGTGNEEVPTMWLGTQRFADVDGDGVFETNRPRGRGEGWGPTFTIAQTGGCNCTQIIDALGLGNGHRFFGCSIGAMEAWIDGL